MSATSVYDVVVLGAGTAGVIAALQSARAGARTLLVEKSGQPGGTITNAGIAFPGLFHAWGRQVIAGIGWELVTDCVREAGGALPDFSRQRDMENHSAYQIRLSAPLYAALCDEKLEAARVEVRYHAMPAILENDRLTLCQKDGLRVVGAQVFIDATGDANAVRIAGGAVRRHAETQPATYSVRAEGYDPDALDYEALARAARRAVADGELAFTDLGWNAHDFSAHFPRARGHNANHIQAADADTGPGRSRLEQDGRAAMLRAYRFLKKQPGLEDLRFHPDAAECGVRESVTIVGERTVTGADYVAGRHWPDSLCNAFYPVDLHTRDGGVTPQALPLGTVPTVPLGALSPSGLERFLVAGRCLSSDRLANSALRVQATCMATGQAAGAAAALAAERGVSPRNVPPADIRVLLARHAAILPDSDNA